MNLAQTQRAFGAWLRGGARPRFGQRARPGLEVYRNTYRSQLVACLEESFPHTRSWIGDESFHAAIVAHVAQVPPTSWTLDAYARDFPGTLRKLYSVDLEVAELAMLERALGDAFVGTDAQPVTAAVLGDIDWDHAILHFTPTLELIGTATNAAAIWSALAAESTPPAAEQLAVPTNLLVWRRQMISCFRTIDMVEADALSLACAATPFAAMCSALTAVHGEAEGVTLAGSFLGRWLADELIVHIEGEVPCDPPSS